MASGIEPWLDQPVAFVALGAEEADIARFLAKHFPRAEFHVHESIEHCADSDHHERPFTKTAACLAGLFARVPGIIVLAPVGVTVRSLAPLLRSKLTDPAVVAVDAVGRYAISLLSGHEGGANRLSLVVADLLGAEPIITTTTEALKRRIVGVGCRRGVAAEEIVGAIQEALADARVSLATVRWLVSADIKRDEPGLRIAAGQLGLPLRFVSSDTIRRWSLTESPQVRRAVDLPAVAEPAAMFAGTRTQCLMHKTVLRPGITVAIAEESLPWSDLAPAAVKTEPTALNEPFDKPR
jgi:cobalt-precorrin 5A hydrolase